MTPQFRQRKERTIHSRSGLRRLTKRAITMSGIEAQLLSCGPIRLRIDFTAVGVVDPLIVDALCRAKLSMEAVGGTFAIIGRTPAMARTMTQGRRRSVRVKMLIGLLSSPN